MKHFESFRYFVMFLPLPFFISRFYMRDLCAIPRSLTCIDFTHPYPQWVSAPVGAKPMSTGHRTPPAIPYPRMYDHVTRLSQRDQITLIVRTNFTQKQLVVDFFSGHDNSTLKTQLTEGMLCSMQVPNFSHLHEECRNPFARIIISFRGGCSNCSTHLGHQKRPINKLFSSSIGLRIIIFYFSKSLYSDCDFSFASLSASSLSNISCILSTSISTLR